MKRLPILLLTLLISFPLHAAKLYKWVDKDGNVHYSQTKPLDAASPEAENAEEMNVSSSVVKPTRRRGKMYCGDDLLPELDDSKARNISTLQRRIYDWEDSVNRRRERRADYAKSNDSLDRRRTNPFDREDDEDRCKIAWAKARLADMQGDKEQIVGRYETVKKAITEVEEQKLAECGQDDRTGFVTVDDEYRRHRKCVDRYDRELRKLKKELRTAEREYEMVDM
jgi:hypothetical protein